jgi:hypothetical protein
MVRAADQVYKKGRHAIIVLDAVVPFAKQGDILALYLVRAVMADGVADVESLGLSGHVTCSSFSVVGWDL